MYKVWHSEAITIQSEEQYSVVARLKCKFVKIRVKRQFYNGRRAIAIYIRDQTLKIKSRLHHHELEERHRTSQQAESYTSTVSHELKTPVQSVIFFFHRLKRNFPNFEDKELALKHFKLIFYQLMLIQSFVDDLLDLRQLKDGVFTLTCNLFDPNQVIEQVCDIFQLQAEAQRISLSFEVKDRLQLLGGSNSKHQVR